MARIEEVAPAGQIYLFGLPEHSHMLSKWRWRHQGNINVGKAKSGSASEQARGRLQADQCHTRYDVETGLGKLVLEAG